MRVLRLCSVYEAPPEAFSAAGRFDVIGGMQVHTARLTAGLDELGVRQTVITSYRSGAPRVHPVGERSRVLRVGVPLRRFRQLYGVAAVPAVAAHGTEDLVHVHLGEDLAIVPLARWAARRMRVPLVVTVHCSLRHTLVPHDVRSAVLRVVGGPAQDWLLRAAATVLVLSDGIADHVVASGIPGSRVRTVPLGVDLGHVRSLPRPQALDGRTWVVYAGRLVSEKGVRDLVAAFERLSTADAGLLVVGDGPDRSALEAAAAGMVTSGRVRFVGAIPHPAVLAYLHHADVVVLPSRSEERGRVLLEAMAAGTPVVATRTGGIPATVEDGVSGLLVPPGDPARLATAIDRVLSDRELAGAMATAGRTTAAQHGIDGLVASTLAAYEAVLDETPHGAPTRQEVTTP